MATKLGKVGKQRVKKAASKRFKKTGKGLWKAMKACGRHLLLQKSTRQKKLGAKGILMAKGDSKTIDSMMAS